jgi:tetratricopeptide (TPR) repeat protein
MDNEQERIKPAAITLSQAGGGESERKKTRSGITAGKIITWISFICLLVIAGGVIFILPDMARPPEPVSTTATGPSTNQKQAAALSTVKSSRPEASPWSEAQLAKLRKDTQDILAELLQQQEALEAINVDQWAEQEYAMALEAAVEGDATYRQRLFEESQDHYQRALDIFNDLQEKSEIHFSENMAQGMESLTNGNSELARSAFQAALLIKPGNDDASKGLLRSMTLDDVFDLIDIADEQAESNNLDDAKQSLQSALELDPDTELALEKLKDVNKKITDRAFNNAMTRGFAALNNSNYESARNEFNKANKIKPNSAEVMSALAQANNNLTSVKISSLLDSAKEHEAQEDWLSAIHAYDQALALDNSLGIAQEGKQHVQWRNNLDKRLAMAIAKPERLSNQAVNREATGLLSEARSITSPGNKLKQQITVLSVMLEESMTPTLVILRSNNNTDVTIYRVGELGLFDRKEIELRPGSYVAVGKREGYRDVRIEFTIIANKTPPPITVQCEERIALRR